ncbi:hypothetical protein [Cupriavidus pauculus]|uniref:Uncharacterized protein n=1 Tax=Cupriavidus pauculus TaxID=82633 RepID=A0A2N5CJE4_9BURK|nr:hypothetical protein [Cupriavidus pauculus]PLQ02331.1 hypothetical protein CYJ10_03285 [Cupriavidus pauculus]
MKALLSKLFGVGVPKHRSTVHPVDPNQPFVVNLYDDHLVVHRPDGQREELSWDSLERVVVRVSDRAPWAGTPWLILAGDADSQQGCVVPMTAANHDALVERLQQLPGFNQQKLDNAMRDAAAGKSRTDANLWKRGSAEAAPVQEEASHDASGQP